MKHERATSEPRARPLAGANDRGSAGPEQGPRPSATEPGRVAPPLPWSAALRLGLLGATSVVVLLVLPLVLQGAGSASAFVVASAPWLLVVLGILGWRRAPRLSTWTLLCAVPGALAAAAAKLFNESGSPASAPSMALGVTTMLAYLAAAAAAASRPARTLPARASALPEEPSRPRRPPLQALAFGGTFVAALAMALVIPFLAPESVPADWGPAGTDGQVLTTVTGAIVGTSALTLFVGPALRRDRKRSPSAFQSRIRIALFAVVVATGILTWSLVAH